MFKLIGIAAVAYVAWVMGLIQAGLLMMAAALTLVAGL